MKLTLSKIISLLFIILFLFSLTSCEVEMEELSASWFISSAKATVWKSGATSIDDVEEKSLFVFSLESGTSATRFSSIDVELNPQNYVGYQIVYCDFTITSDTDAKLTLEPIVRYGESGGGVSQGKNTVSLIAGVENEVSLSIGISVEYARQEIFLSIDFGSVLPFASSEDGDGEYIDLADWSKIEYEISGMKFYGAQTTAT